MKKMASYTFMLSFYWGILQSVFTNMFIYMFYKHTPLCRDTCCSGFFYLLNNVAWKKMFFMETILLFTNSQLNLKELCSTTMQNTLIVSKKWSNFIFYTFLNFFAKKNFNFVQLFRFWSFCILYFMAFYSFIFISIYVYIFN